MAPREKSRLRKMASGLVFWLGLALIGVLAIPAGILFGLIALIWEALSFLLRKIEKD